MAAPEPVELLERDDEVRALARMVNAARRGAGGVAVVEAPGGLGKTSLLDETARRAEAIGMPVLAARGLETEQEFAFGLVRRLAEATVRGKPELFTGAAAIAAPVFGVGEAETQTVRDPGFPLLHGLYWLLAGLAEREPLLLVVDDLHWADRPSLRFVQFLVPRLRDLPVLLAIGCRPGEPGSALDDVARAELLSHPEVDLLQPAPLGPEAVAEVVRGRFGESAGARFCAACAEVTGGSPFLLGELLTELHDEGVAAVDAAAERVREIAPDAVARAVLVRLARLGPEATAMAEALAVLGDGHEARIVSAQAGVDADATDATLRALVQARILAPARPLAFLHPLLRNAVYAQLDPTGRATAHARAAVLLRDERAGAERIAAHLLHTEPAGDAGAVAILREAAAAALARGGAGAAVAFLKRAGAEGAAVDAGSLEAERFRAALAHGNWDEMDALDIDALAGNVEFLVRHGAEIALILVRTGRAADAPPLLEHARARVKEPDLALRLEADLIGLTPFHPELKERLAPRVRELLATPPAGRTPGERAMLTSLLLLCPEMDVPYPAAAEMAKRAVAGGELLRERGPESFPLQSALMLLGETHEGQAIAAPIVDAALEDSRRRALSLGFVLSSAVRGDLAHKRGDLIAAEADCRAARDVASDGGWLRVAPSLSSALIQIQLDRGDVAGAVETRETAQWDELIDDPVWAWQTHLTRARLSLELGHAEDALRDAAAVAADGEQWPAHETVAEALTALGRREEALALMRLKLARNRRLQTVFGEAHDLRTLGRLVGGDEGIDLLERSAELSRTTPNRLGLAAAQLELGALLRRMRRRADAREPLRSAFELAMACGASALAERARHELAATGETVRRPASTGVDELTPTEARIAGMAADGMSNREIAQALFVTVKNVEGNLTRAYRKLGIRGRADLPTALPARKRSAA